nr:hypothetical protein [Tanacetum cinerariifolium]
MEDMHMDYHPGNPRASLVGLGSRGTLGVRVRLGSACVRLRFEGLVRRFLTSDEFSRVQGELLSLAASVSFELGLYMDRTQELLAGALKNISQFVLGAQGVVQHICEDVNRVESSLIQDSRFASFGSPNVVVALSVEKEKENAPHSSQDTPVTAPVDARDDVSPFGA